MATLTYVDEEEVEILHVEFSNAVVGPGAVMVHASHTSTTLSTYAWKKNKMKHQDWLFASNRLDNHLYIPMTRDPPRKGQPPFIL